MAAATTLAWAVLAGAGADAQTPGLSISPANPAAGETITVSGLCFGTSPENEKVVGDRVDVMLVDHPLEDVTQAYSEFVQKAAATPAADFTWSASLQIPVNAQPDQVFFVVTQCLHRFSGFYQSGSFGVGLPASATSTTAPAGDTTATGTAPGATAPPVAARPSVTG